MQILNNMIFVSIIIDIYKLSCWFLTHLYVYYKYIDFEQCLLFNLGLIFDQYFI